MIGGPFAAAQIVPLFPAPIANSRHGKVFDVLLKRHFGE